VNFLSSAFSGNKRGGNSLFFLDFESFLFSLVKEDYNNKQIEQIVNKISSFEKRR